MQTEFIGSVDIGYKALWYIIYIMILFYSEYCQHCTVLLDTIKRFDKANNIKLVSVDTLRSLQKPIDHKIKSVPALYLMDSKKFLFGKEVFDHLILKNKLSFAGETTRDNKKNKDLPDASIGINGGNSSAEPGQPQAFSLGAISSEFFSSIEDSGSMISDKNYNWDLITNNMPIDTDAPVAALGQVSAIQGPAIPNVSNASDPKDESKKLPTMEEIMKQRANDIM
jgi:hypothetical protein